jgi:hypothetical protein
MYVEVTTILAITWRGRKTTKVSARIRGNFCAASATVCQTRDNVI